MFWLQGHLKSILAVLVLISIQSVYSRSTCKSPKRYLDDNRECVKCPPERDCPERSYKSRECGYGFQTECLPCLNCTIVYRTEWKPCTAASQTECGDCLEGFFTFMGTCVHETAWEASTFVWRSESSMEEVLTTGAYHTATVVPSTPEVAIASSTTPHLPIFIGISSSAAVLFFVLGLATFRLRKARPSSSGSDCERSGRTDDGIHGDGCGGRVSLTDELSSDTIPTIRRKGTELSTDSGCDVLWPRQDSSDVDSRNPSLTESLSPMEILQSAHFYTMEGNVNVFANTAEVGMYKNNKLWVDVASATLGVDGGCLGLPALDTYLCIDSVERDTDIELAVLKNPKYLPTLAKGESLASPIISCSPHGLSFPNPALLSFPHCGDMTSSDVTLLVSDTSLDEAPKWREASLDGSCGVSYMVKGSECLVYTSHFTLFGLKAKAKQVKIMIFSRLLPNDRFFEVHVFCVNDTPESLHEIEYQERKNSFHLKCPPKEITFLSNDKDVKVKMSLNTKDGWEMPTQHKQVIGYAAVQQNSNPQGQYVTFHLRAVSHDTCASVHVVASQKSSSSIAEFDFPLSLTSNEEKDTPYPHGSSAIEQFLSSEQSPTPESFLYYLSMPRSAFQPKAISQDLQEKLISRLDVKVDTGNDFRLFADELGFDSFQRTLLDQRFDSPTHCLLMYMELRAQKRRQSSSEMLQELAQILYRIDRSDLAKLIERHLQQRPYSIISNSTDSTDSGLGPGSYNGSQLSVATSASGETIGLASPLDKPHLETTSLLEGDPQNLSPAVHVVHPARTANQDGRGKVETEV